MEDATEGLGGREDRIGGRGERAGGRGERTDGVEERIGAADNGSFLCFGRGGGMGECSRTIGFLGSDRSRSVAFTLVFVPSPLSTLRLLATEDDVCSEGMVTRSSRGFFLLNPIGGAGESLPRSLSESAIRPGPLVSRGTFCTRVIEDAVEGAGLLS